MSSNGMETSAKDIRRYTVLIGVALYLSITYARCHHSTFHALNSHSRQSTHRDATHMQVFVTNMLACLHSLHDPHLTPLVTPDLLAHQRPTSIASGNLRDLAQGGQVGVISTLQTNARTHTARDTPCWSIEPSHRISILYPTFPPSKLDYS